VNPGPGRRPVLAQPPRPRNRSHGQKGPPRGGLSLDRRVGSSWSTPSLIAERRSAAVRGTGATGARRPGATTGAPAAASCRASARRISWATSKGLSWARRRACP